MTETAPQIKNQPQANLLHVSGILQRKCACGNQTIGGGKCAECGKKEHILQRKLTIGASNDPLEQEADRVADEVLSRPAQSIVSNTPSIRRLASPSVGQIDEAPPSVDRVLAGPGRSLEPALRQDMEQRFGYDFSRVRVHSGAAAEQSAQEVNAHAYTVGYSIIFGAGQFSPGTMNGRKLLAHELTHVLQQSTNNGSILSSDHHSRFDQKTDGVATAPKVDNAVGILAQAAPQVQRAAPVAAAAPAAAGLAWICATGAMIGMAFDAAIQYALHLWRLRRWPWERARETWETYRHDWCSTVLSAVLGCFGAIAAHRWLQPFLRRTTPLGGATGATLLGRLLMWLATQGMLTPRIAVKWLG